jgi:ribulose-5-phosphate 4-epimerase/fuculose-1-phosphate aldolase
MNAWVNFHLSGPPNAFLAPAAHVLVCANHGMVVVSASLSEAMEDLYYFEGAAMNHLLAMGSGRTLKQVGGHRPPPLIAPALRGDTSAIL